MAIEFIDLPEEILEEIFLSLSLSDVRNAALVCKGWNRVLESERLWESWYNRSSARYFVYSAVNPSIPFKEKLKAVLASYNRMLEFKPEIGSWEPVTTPLFYRHSPGWRDVPRLFLRPEIWFFLLVFFTIFFVAFVCQGFDHAWRFLPSSSFLFAFSFSFILLFSYAAFADSEDRTRPLMCLCVSVFPFISSLLWLLQQTVTAVWTMLSIYIVIPVALLFVAAFVAYVLCNFACVSLYGK